MEFEFCHSIHSIDPRVWDELFSTANPFTSHAFLSALEDSGCVVTKTGWKPCHIIGKEDNGNISLVAPCYLKYHSYGEYVFDWSWANAFQQHGLEYYPKLICAIPFTPSTGARVACKNADSKRLLIDKLPDLLKSLGVSGCHLLFPPVDDCSAWLDKGWAQRQNTQYHWYNRDYARFEDFVATFVSRKRKTLNRERRRIAEQGLHCEAIEGSQASKEVWDSFYQCYQVTYLKRSGHQGYLNRKFFDLIASTMAESVVFFIARDHDDIVACALCFKDAHNLYGRYWGCLQEYDQLHFELCYYQGIEYCISHGLQHFDPGAQGEHKIQRGFEPITTYSMHYLTHAGFQQAVLEFCHQEAEENAAYQAAARELLPFKTCE